jgi:hypothetical protein
MGLGTVSPLVLNLMAIAANFKTFQFQPIYYSALHIYFFLETHSQVSGLGHKHFSKLIFINMIEKLIFVAVCNQILRCLRCEKLQNSVTFRTRLQPCAR